VFVALAAWSLAACGGATPEPRDQARDGEELDVIGSIVGDVEVDLEAVEEIAEEEETYTGPTTLTINLRVVDQRTPQGSYTLKDAGGKVVVDKGELGKPVQVNQGAYTIEFRSPVVFGNPVYVLKDVAVAGPEQTIDETFPAGRLTLNTHRGATFKRCTPIAFTVVRMANEEPLEGTGRTCEPLYIEAGHYELRLQLSKTKYQPVEIRVNREQMTEAPIQLEN